MAKEDNQELAKKKLNTNGVCLVIHVGFSSYPVVEDIARNVFGFKITKEPTNEWDILWSDTVRFLS